MVAPLLEMERVDLLLALRANGEQPCDLAARFDLDAKQISRLIYKHRDRLRALCASLGVEPPKRGGSVPGRRYDTRNNAHYIPRPRARDAPDFYSKPRTDGRPPPKILPCLGCGADHNVTWAGDRMCRGCKQSEMWQGGDGLSGDILEIGVRNKKPPRLEYSG